MSAPHAHVALRALALVALVSAGLAPGASAQRAPRGGDPDWPCQQPLVPVLSAAAVWSGPPLEGLGDWHAEPVVAALVDAIAPRRVAAAEGTAAIGDFLAALDQDRPRLASLAFAGLLEETNRARGELISRLKLLAQRQRNLAELVARLNAELEGMPVPAPGTAAPQRDELVQRVTFTSRSFQELQRTMRYACEAPVELDARLGAYARALQAGLP